jgi:imidazolonepropionase-like amidohydrolase
MELHNKGWLPMRLLGGRAVTGDGTTVLENVLITITGSTITSVVRVDRAGIQAAKRESDVVDLGDSTLLPGLFDLHAHFAPTRSENEVSRQLEPPELRLLRGAADCMPFLKAGFTTARCPGGTEATFLRDAIREGTLKGPDIYSAGRSISATAGHGDRHHLPREWMDAPLLRSGEILADGVSQCRAAVRQQIREGADFIKVYTAGGAASRLDDPKRAQYSTEELLAIVEEAKRNEMKVAAHAGGAGITTAVEAGVDTIEHAYYCTREQAQLMAKHKVTYVPTALRVYVGVTEGPKVGATDWVIQRFNDAWPFTQKALRYAHEEGVKIALGSDFGHRAHTRHGSHNAKELQLLVEYGGLSEIEAIASATSVAADAMGLGSRRGLLEPGKDADIIAVKGNPLKDISLLESSVCFVMKGGEIVRNDMALQ